MSDHSLRLILAAIFLNTGVVSCSIGAGLKVPEVAAGGASLAFVAGIPFFVAWFKTLMPPDREYPPKSVETSNELAESQRLP